MNELSAFCVFSLLWFYYTAFYCKNLWLAEKGVILANIVSSDMTNCNVGIPADCETE